MTATAVQTTGWDRIGSQTQLPPGGDADPQATTTQVGMGQATYFDLAGTTGKVALSDGTVPGLICAGVGDDRLTAPGSSVRLWKGHGSGAPGATGAGDAVGAGDQLVPVFDAGNGVAGKLSNVAGNDRPFMGLAFGLNDQGYPIIWAGPEASALARAIHALNAESAGNVGYAVDATATTDLGSVTTGALTTIGFVIPRAKRRSIVTGVEIIPSAALALALTNYRVIQFWKVDTTGTVAIAASPLVATFSTLTQNLVAGQPTAFTLGAASALLLRETDLLVGTSLHIAGGATVPQSAIRANCKVI